ncbi:MAG: ABC transporter permease [Verrucomicrobiota bacterium]
MSWLRYKLRTLFQKKDVDAEMAEEMKWHIENQTLVNIAAGMSRAEAGLAARRQFGWVESIKERCREQRGVRWLENLSRNLRYGVRQLWKNPGFSAMAVLTLALGIGTCTSMFSMVNAVLFKPLPFQQPTRLVWIENINAASGLSGRTSRIDTFVGWRAQSRSFESLAAYHAFSGNRRLTMTGGGAPERLRSVAVADNFLPTLGVAPLHGRNFVPEECTFAGPGAVILSHRYWQRRFAGDPAIIGQFITLNNKPNAVVGVLPPAFDFSAIFTPGSEVDVLTPLPLSPETIRQGNIVFGIGRLRTGVTIDQALTELTLISERLRQTIKGVGPFGAHVCPLDSALRGKFRGPFLFLAAAVACVLAIACANLSNLLLARLNARRPEFAVRHFLGASRRHLIEQTLTESVLLAFAGSAIGVPLAAWATQRLARLDSFGVPLLQNASVDFVALAVTIGITTLAGIACGLLPAFHLAGGHDARGPQDATHQRSAGRSAAFARSALIVAEVALACMLLVCAGLLLRSFNSVLRVNLGFQPQHGLTWRIDPTRTFKSGQELDRYLSGMAGAIAALPGVEVVGFSDTLPLGRNRSWGAGEVGVQYADGQYPTAYPRLVDPNYLRAMKIPLMAGRHFAQNIASNSAKAVIINQNLAHLLWPGRDPIGRQIDINGGSTVVGVVANVRHSSLEEAEGNEMYLDCRQCGDWSALEMVVRSSRSADALVPDVRAALAVYDPMLPTEGVRQLEDLIDAAIGPREFITRLLGFFSTLALALAAVGLYAVIAYSVTQRSQEIGIRMAIGAQRRDVLQLVLQGGLKLVAIGVVFGLVGSLALTTLLKSLLFGVTAHDPLVFAGNAALLTAVAGVACLVPAFRATKGDPLSVLRS